MAIEQQSKNGLTRTIFDFLNQNTKSVVTQPFPKVGDRQGLNLSVHQTRKGTLVGLYFPYTNKFEVHSPDLSGYALYVYQMVSNTTFAVLTDKLTFAVSYSEEERASRVFVISNWIASTSDTPGRCKFPRAYTRRISLIF